MGPQLVTAKHFRADEVNGSGLRTKGNPINTHTLHTAVDGRRQGLMEGHRCCSSPEVPDKSPE